jgi:murein DD-endopeptidase MepM/ murein hydrolase activator NlpD
MVFPVVAKRVDFTSAFHSGHPGVDIFALKGSPVVAISSGIARESSEPKGGNVIYLVEPDGTQYFYGHLSNTEGRFPREVLAGEVIGYVGTTGSAQGTALMCILRCARTVAKRSTCAVLNALPVRSQSLEDLDLSQGSPISSVHRAQCAVSVDMKGVLLMAAIAWYLHTQSTHGESS